MDKNFKSQALQANLAETRYKDIHIPEHHKKFIDLSEKYFGIHKRAQECITEFHHPLSNKKFVAEELRKILITDYWFYKASQNPSDAFEVVLQILHELLSSDIKPREVRTIIRTLLEFNKKALEDEFYDSIHLALKVLVENIQQHSAPYIQSTGLFKKHLEPLLKNEKFSSESIDLLRKVLNENIRFWSESMNIHDWLKDHPGAFNPETRQEVISFVNALMKDVDDKIEKADTPEKVLAVKGYEEIAESIEHFSSKLPTFIQQFHYIFFLLQLQGMKEWNERLIWKIDKFLRQAIDEVPDKELPGFAETLFALCHNMRQDHMSSVLDILLTLGKKIIDRDKTEDKSIINDFEKKLIDFGFETPGMVYVNEEWQLHVNENHIKNIRVWLELIEYSQSIMEKLLAALIVNLRLGGIFISDTDLFQREITKILNSNIAPYYKKVKQLTRIFPVYFNEIGAEGEIRDTTTAMDEVFKRQDKLVHFLRKQVHTESNNTLITLTEKVFQFWFDGNKQKLKPILPADVYDAVDTESSYFTQIHQIMRHICTEYNLSIGDFMSLGSAKAEEILDQLPQEISNEKDKLRLSEGIKLYALLKEKYSFETVNIIPMMKAFPGFKKENITAFEKALKNQDFEKSLQLIYHFMEELKSIIFNPEPSEGWENIYHKRHIAIGIPSMYGVYREPKFEALGLTFRLERIATRLMEKVVQNINLNYISNKTLQDIFKILDYFREGLELDGITSQAFNSNLSMLKYSLTSRSFSLHQYINIFQFMADDVKKIINKYFLKSYEYPLQIIIPQLFNGNKTKDKKEMNRLLNEKSEVFYRDIISSAFLVQPLDNFVSRILDSLQTMVDSVKPEWIHDIMTYNSDMTLTALQKRNPALDNQVFLGSKAYFLKKLYLNGMPVPPGFVISTEVFRRIDTIMHHPVIRQELEQLLSRQLKGLEKLTGRRYGDPANALLTSVRSGTAISMPGAMDTFLNVGMNDEFTEKLSKQPNFAWTSWDCYRRLIQSWGMFHGIDRDVFDQIMIDFKEKHHVDLKVQFKPEIMREIAFSYKDVLKENNVVLEENLFDQLIQTIMFVFQSWSSERAQVYRDHLQIADEWGTAVIVQQMVIGNLNLDSGTGVVFTQNPNRQRPGVHLYGDFTLTSQGEDIVGGLVNVHPVGKTQRKQQNIEEESLQEMLPDIYKRIHQIATELTENQGYNPQEIEFTFESSNPDDLYILQTRDQDITMSNKINIFSTRRDEMHLAGRGTGIGGGAMNGIIAFDKTDIKKVQSKNPDQPVILVRPDTVPDDIEMIFECDGLLTAKGGATSHAAVTAVRLGKTCVVNCSALQVDEENKTCRLNETTFKNGDKIAIDGKNGNIFKGHYPIEETEDTAL